MFPFHKFDTNDNKRTHLLSENGLHDHEPPAVAILNSNPFRDLDLAVQWSCLSFHRRGHGFLSGQGTKIPTAGQEKKRKNSFPFRKGTLVRGYQAGRLLLLRHFSRVQLLTTPWTAAH